MNWNWRTTRMVKLATYAVKSVALALPIGGFVFGFLVAQGGDEDSFLLSILGRILVGIVFAFLTPITFGFPPRNEAGTGEPLNAWPCIGISALIIFALFLMRDYRRKTPPTKP